MDALLLFLIPPILGLVVVGVGLATGVYAVNVYNAKKNKPKFQFYQIMPPRGVRAEQEVDWWVTVAATFENSDTLPNPSEIVIIELRATFGETMTLRLGLPWEHRELVGQLRAHIQGVRIEKHKIETFPDWKTATEAGVSDNSRQLDVENLVAQSKRILTAAQEEMKKGSATGIQLVINPIGRPRLLGVSKAVFGVPNTTEDKAQVAKREQHQFRVALRIVAAGEELTHAKKLESNIKNAYKALRSSHVHLAPSLTAKFGMTGKIISDFNTCTPPAFWPGKVSALELTALSPFPIGIDSMAGMQINGVAYLPPNEYIARDGISVGKAAAEGYRDRVLALSNEDLFRSVWILGPAGSGKTTLTENLFAQWVNKGNSGHMIETKGDLFYRGLESVHPDHVDNFIVIDLSDDSHSVGLNILHEGDARSTVQGLIDLFIKGVPDPKLFNDAAYHAWHTLRLVPGTTAIDIITLLDPNTPAEEAWQEWVIDQVPKSRPELLNFWSVFKRRTANDRRYRVTPVTNRLWKFNSLPGLRRFLGQSESTFSLRDAIVEGKNVMLYAPHHLGSEEVTLFTSLFVNEMWRIIQQTKGLKKKPTLIFADEAQRLGAMPVDLADMVTVMRGYEAGLVGGHQFMGQLTPDVLRALTTAGTKLAYRLDGPDARAWQSIIGNGIVSDDVMNLEPYQAIARLASNGGSSDPVSIQTSPPPHRYGRAKEIIRRSRDKYARPAEDIDAEILRRRSAPAKPRKERPTFGFVDEEDEG